MATERDAAGIKRQAAGSSQGGRFAPDQRGKSITGVPTAASTYEPAAGQRKPAEGITAMYARALATKFDLGAASVRDWSQHYFPDAAYLDLVDQHAGGDGPPFLVPAFIYDGSGKQLWRIDTTADRDFYDQVCEFSPFLAQGLDRLEQVYDIDEDMDVYRLRFDA